VTMKTVRHTDKDFSAKLRAAAADSSLFDAEIEARTKAILHDVFVRGDAAVLDFTEKYDGAKLTAEQLAVTQAELFTPRSPPMITAHRRGGSRKQHRRLRQKILAQRLVIEKIPMVPASAKSLIRSRASAFTFPAAPRRWFRRR